MTEYVGPHVYKAPISGRYLFTRKARLVRQEENGSAVFETIGKPIDVTDSVAKLVSDAVKADRRKRRR